ncbi:uncharacterized protein LOC142337070 [Convolutriloba macropyga]|uniref:uncharacterized protein LOC142337070 n=1 Tax=Convolutriloba macropyga TaxID=536237 RepID=UPI003F51E34B
MASLAVKPTDLTFPPDFKLYGGNKNNSSAGKIKQDNSQPTLLKPGAVNKDFSRNLNFEVVSHQRKEAPKPAKQQKYIVSRVTSNSLSNDLSKIVTTVSRGQRSNIDDFTKGHLNERHLNPIVPAQLGDVELKWGEKYAKPIKKKSEHKKPVKPKGKPAKGVSEYKTMNYALQEFVMRTAGANNLLSTVFEDTASEQAPPRTSSAKTRNPPPDQELEITELEEDQLILGTNEEIPENEERKGSLTSEDLGIYEADESTINEISVLQNIHPTSGSNWHKAPQVEEVKPGEVKLPKIQLIKKPSHTPTPPGTPGEAKTKFLTSHFYGATKKDQFSGFLGFQSRVLNFENREVKLVSNNMASKYYKDKLRKLLTSFPSKTIRASSPNLEKVFAHGQIWDDLVKDLPIFGPVLAVIKNEYENYLRHLALNERHKLESGSLESEVTGLLTAGTAVTSASGGGKRGVVGGGGDMGHVMESDVIVEEESRNSEMEAEIELLMEGNRSLHEQIKSVRRRVEARKETRKLSLLGETDQVPDELKLSRSEIVLGLREEILSTMKKIEATKSEMKHDMVPRVLSQSIHDLANQDQKLVERYSELCERVIEMSTQVGKEFNDELGRAVISPMEIKMLWRKLKTMNVVGKYVLTNERPIMSSEGTEVQSESANQNIEEAVSINQSDIEAVTVEQKIEDSCSSSQSPSTVHEPRPESSRREDFDFYF